jgi:Mg2+ and Co2+ transporter CorA
MKVLTLLSAIALPGVVVAGIMGMNFKAPIFDNPDNFMIVIGAMVAFSLSILGVARWRRWV